MKKIAATLALASLTLASCSGGERDSASSTTSLATSEKTWMVESPEGHYEEMYTYSPSFDKNTEIQVSLSDMFILEDCFYGEDGMGDLPNKPEDHSVLTTEVWAFTREEADTKLDEAWIEFPGGNIDRAHAVTGCLVPTGFNSVDQVVPKGYYVGYALNYLVPNEAVAWHFAGHRFPLDMSTVDYRDY